MKIKIKIYDTTYSVKIKNQTAFNDFMEEIKNISKMLYSEELVNKYWE